MSDEEDRTCRLCGGPGLKRRVQVLPWKMVCVFVCRGCMPRMAETIQEVRAAYERELESS